MALNALFLCGLLYTFLKEAPPSRFGESYALHSESKAVIADGELAQTIEDLKRLPLDELWVKLSDKRLVEHGFTVGDLTASALSGFYCFDLERALGRPLEKKAVVYGTQGETLPLFTNLTEQDYNTLEAFIKRERWPFSAQGLFRILKNPKFRDDKSLQETFFLTPEFITVERLVSTPVHKVDKEELLKLLLSADWGKLAAFYEIQKQSSDWSEVPRRLFLLDWVHAGSVEAAALLYHSEADFVAKKLDDKTTLALLRLLNEEDKKHLSQKLLLQPRSEEVRKMALAFAGEPKDLKSPPIFRPPTEGIYIVEPNDSLWKIARKLNISMELIRQMNGLTSDQLKPGRPLRIPGNRSLPDAKGHTSKAVSR
jgi:hypothetical protein